MSTPAQVRSTQSIEAFRIALVRFEQRVLNALDALESEMRRAADWIDHDRPAFWREQLKQAEGGVHQAKLDLEHCLMMTVAGERPACREQQAAVRDWKARVEYCRDKIEAVRKWRRTFQHELLEHHGRIGQLRRVVEQDLPQARAVLAKILARLDAYQIERPPDAPPAVAIQGDAIDRTAARHISLASGDANPDATLSPADGVDAANSNHVSPTPELQEQ